MIGIEVIENPHTRAPAPPHLRDWIVGQCFERGLLLLGCGENTIRIAPPLVLTQEQADFCADTLEALFTALERS